MADPLPIMTPDIPVYQDRRLSDYSASNLDVLGALVGDTLHDNTIAELSRLNAMSEAEGGLTRPGRGPSRFVQPDTPLLSPDDAKARLDQEGLTGQIEVPDTGIREGALNLLMANRQAINRRNAITSRSPGGFWLTAGGITAQLGTSLLDPVNVAMAFMPVVGEARYGRMLAAAGESVLGRAAVRAGVGAVEGAAGTAALQPIQIDAAHAYQEDYGMNDALANVAYGGLFGAVLHSIAGAGGDALSGYRMGRGVPLEHQQAALSEAISSFLEDRQPRVSEVMASIRRDELLGSTAIGRATEPNQDFVVGGYPPQDRTDLETISPEEAGIRRAQDVEERARQIDPQTFGEYDRLQTERQTYNRWITELEGTRAEQGTGAVADIDRQIAEQKQRLADAPNQRKAKTYQARIDDLQAQRDARFREATTGDTPDMATVRQKLQQADFRMRDLAEKVSAAKRRAEAETPATAPHAETPQTQTRPAAFDAEAALNQALQPRSLLDTLTQIRDDRVNLRPDDARLVAEVQRQTPNYDKPLTPDASDAEVQSYAEATDDAVANAVAAGKLSDADRALLAEADNHVVQSEYAGQGWKAAAGCIARALG